MKRSKAYEALLARASQRKADYDAAVAELQSEANSIVKAAKPLSDDVEFVADLGSEVTKVAPHLSRRLFDLAYALEDKVNGKAEANQDAKAGG